jgi:hypothetical protein
MSISIENLLEDEQGLSMGEMLTVDFGTPSYEFIINICMSILEFVVYTGN